MIVAAVANIITIIVSKGNEKEKERKTVIDVWLVMK